MIFLNMSLAKLFPEAMARRKGVWGEFRRARAHRIACAARSAASCQFLEIFAKIGSSVVV